MAAADHSLIIVAWNNSNIKHYFYSFNSLINKIKLYKQCFYDWNVTIFDYDRNVLYDGNFGIYCEDHTWLFGGEK